MMENTAITSGGAGPLGGGYPIPVRALDTWWKFDIKRHLQPDGATHYVYRYLGSTCTNAGSPIESWLHAVLRPAGGRMIVERAWIEFDEEDEGHQRMCEYGLRGREIAEELRQPAAFSGQPLEEALASLVEINPAGCFCQPAMINHKWRQMLCAIHYGLSRPQA